RTKAARTTTAEALLHVLHLLFLGVREDLGDLGIDFLLQLFHLLFLFGRQPQGVLKERRHDLSGLRRTREPTWSTPSAGAAEAAWTTRAETHPWHEPLALAFQLGLYRVAAFLHKRPQVRTRLRRSGRAEPETAPLLPR